MELKPHGLNVDLKVELLGKKKSIKKQRSSFEATIEVDNGQNKGKLVFPMRSFNKYLLEWLWQMFQHDVTTSPYNSEAKSAGIDTKLKTVMGVAGTNAGLVLGTKAGADYLNVDTVVLEDVLAHSTSGTTNTVNYNAMLATQITQINSNSNYGFTIKRKISNQTSADTLYPQVIGTKLKHVHGASETYIAFDKFDDGIIVSFIPLSDLNLTFSFYVTTNGVLGGLTKNFTDIIKYLLFTGTKDIVLNKYNNSSLVYEYASNITATSATKNMLNLIPTTATVGKGIVLINRPNDDADVLLPINAESVALPADATFVSGLTLGTNTITKISKNGNRVSFTIYRDFINDTTGQINATRAAIISGKGEDIELILAHNALKSGAYLNIPAGDTLRVSYTFSTEM